jgi:hypothetical protein
MLTKPILPAEHDPEAIEPIAGARSRSFSRTHLAAALGGALLVGLVWLASARTAPGFSAVPSVRSDKADLLVDYTIQTSPTASHFSTLNGVSVIEFHPNYVIVKQKKGSGVVFFNQFTRNLSWHP